MKFCWCDSVFLVDDFPGLDQFVCVLLQWFACCFYRIRVDVEKEKTCLKREKKCSWRKIKSVDPSIEPFLFHLENFIEKICTP